MPQAMSSYQVSKILSTLCLVGIVLQLTVFKGSNISATVLLLVGLATLGNIIYTVVKARKEK